MQEVRESKEYQEEEEAIAVRTSTTRCMMREIISGVEDDNNDEEFAAAAETRGRRRMKAAAAEVLAMLPAWLEGLMGETFFGACGAHQNLRKNERNVFCLTCCHSFCHHCLPSHHPSHPLLQVRRYVYQDVIRMDDLEKLIDCSYIQAYTINRAKVIFLNERAQSASMISNCKTGRGHGNIGSSNTCFTCQRILQDPFNFCSLSCKVHHHILVHGGEDLSSILCCRLDDQSDFAISQLEMAGLRVDGSDVHVARDGPSSVSSILEDPSEYGAVNCDNEECSDDYSRVLMRTRTGNFSNKKGGSNSIVLSNFGSKRKGAPHRSPLS